MLYPTPGDTLPTLDSRPKPAYVGLSARFVGLVVSLASRFQRFDAWAASYTSNYFTTIGLTIYRPPHAAALTDSLWLHEGIHGWQSKNRLLYRLDYLLRPRRGRLQLEAQAYAAEVVAGWRTLTAATIALTGRTYYPEPWYQPTAGEGRAALEAAVAGWREAGFDEDSIRALGRTAIGVVH